MQAGLSEWQIPLWCAFISENFRTFHWNQIFQTAIFKLNSASILKSVKCACHWQCAFHWIRHWYGILLYVAFSQLKIDYTAEYLTIWENCGILMNTAGKLHVENPLFWYCSFIPTPEPAISAPCKTASIVTGSVFGPFSSDTTILHNIKAVWSKWSRRDARAGRNLTVN